MIALHTRRIVCFSTEHCTTGKTPRARTRAKVVISCSTFSNADHCYLVHSYYVPWKRASKRDPQSDSGGGSHFQNGCHEFSMSHISSQFISSKRRIVIFASSKISRRQTQLCLTHLNSFFVQLVHFKRICYAENLTIIYCSNGIL